MKKLIAILLFLSIAASTVISATALTQNTSDPTIAINNEYTVGDVNGDREVNAKDVFAINLYNANIGEINLREADINYDGKVNAKDLLALKKHFTGNPEYNISNITPDAIINKLTIAGADVAEFEIVYPADAKYVENIFYAASTLKKYIDIAINSDIPIVSESNSSKKIEFVDVTTVDGLEEELGIEGYKYEVNENGLFIYGTKRGSLYAVWEILEDYLGYRFYSDDFVNAYFTPSVDIPAGTNSYHIPALSMRYAYHGFSEEGAEIHYLPRRLNANYMTTYSDEAYGTLTGPLIIPEEEDPEPFNFYYRMATGIYDVDYEADGALAYKAKYEAGKDNFKKGSYINGVYYPSWSPCFTDDEQYETLFRGILEALRYVSEWQNIRDDNTLCVPVVNSSRVVCSCTSCKIIMMDGTTGRGENKIERLNAGEAGLYLYLANKVAKDLTEYYEGRPASTFSDGIDSNGDEAGYGDPIYDEYPDAKVIITLYAPDLPNEKMLTDERYESIVPSKNLIIKFDTYACQNHPLGSEKCVDNHAEYYENGDVVSKSLKAWGEIAKVCNVEYYYTYYVSSSWTLLVTPIISDLWHNVNYLITECGFTGIEFIGGKESYMLEELTADLAAELMWSYKYNENGQLSYMSYDEYETLLMKKLQYYYGDGYMDVYNYLLMLEEAMELKGDCYSLWWGPLPGDTFDHTYFTENYEEMRAILVSALEKVDGKSYERIENLLINCDLVGLTACYNLYYANGTEELKDVYTERYTYLYNYIVGNNIKIYHNTDSTYPELYLNDRPLVLFYDRGTYDPFLEDEWGYTYGWWGYT